MTVSPAAVAEETPTADKQPSVAVLTMTRDEGSMLTRWVHHYGTAVGHENLLVLDDHSSDGSTAGLECPVIPLPQMPGGRRFEITRMRIVNGFAAGLLACHDVVIFVDVDEFLIPDPDRYPDLRTFLAARRNVPVIAPMALNVLHVPAVEPKFDPRRPVLEQRSFAKFTPVMCKPSIKRLGVRWTSASHGVNQPFSVDPELFMLHLKFYDRDHLRDTAARRSAMVAEDGRAERSNWRRGAELSRMIRRLTADADPDAAPEFDPRSVDLDPLVIKGHGSRYRTRRQGQVGAMRTRPLVRIPSRLKGAL